MVDVLNGEVSNAVGPSQTPIVAGEKDKHSQGITHLIP